MITTRAPDGANKHCQRHNGRRLLKQITTQFEICWLFWKDNALSLMIIDWKITVVAFEANVRRGLLAAVFIYNWKRQKCQWIAVCSAISLKSWQMTRLLGVWSINLLSEADDFCHVSNGVVLSWFMTSNCADHIVHFQEISSCLFDKNATVVKQKVISCKFGWWPSPKLPCYNVNKHGGHFNQIYS